MRNGKQSPRRAFATAFAKNSFQAREIFGINVLLVPVGPSLQDTIASYHCINRTVLQVPQNQITKPVMGRDRSRSRDRDRKRARSGSRERRRERSRSKERDRSHRDKHRSRHTDGDRHRDKDRDSHRKHDREQEKDRTKDEDRERRPSSEHAAQGHAPPEERSVHLLAVRPAGVPGIPLCIAVACMQASVCWHAAAGS